MSDKQPLLGAPTKPTNEEDSSDRSNSLRLRQRRSKPPNGKYEKVSGIDQNQSSVDFLQLVSLVR